MRIPVTIDLLDTLILKLQQARGVAERGRFFDSYQGAAAINAMHDLTGCDELYVLAQDVEHDAGPERLCAEDSDPYFAGAYGFQRPQVAA